MFGGGFDRHLLACAGFSSNGDSRVVSRVEREGIKAIIPLIRLYGGGEADDEQTRKACFQQRHGMAYVFRAGYVSENAEVQRLRLRLWCSWKCEIPSCKIETCLESADAKGRSLSGLLPFVGYVLWGGAALMVALPHIDILDKLASLVNIHLLINMANVGIHGMG